MNTIATGSLVSAPPAGTTTKADWVQHPQRLPSPGCSRALLTAVLPLADAAALALAGCVVAVTAGHITGRTGWIAAAYLVAAWAALSASGLHRLRITLRLPDQAGRILAAVGAPAVATLPWVPAGFALRAVVYSAGIVLATRWLAYAVLRAARRRGHLIEPALLVGAGQTGEKIAGLLQDHPELGLRPCGFLDTSPLASGLALPLLGVPADLLFIAVRLGIRRVIVCFPDGRDEELVPVVRACRDLQADICVVPRLHELGTAVPRGCLDEVRGIPLIPLRSGWTTTGRLAKRAFDIVVAAILLALSAPVLAVLALVIRVRRQHPVLFRQVRVVGSGRRAEIVKLRTLGEHADADTRWVVPTQQMTPLGNWLRASHLDELPQLVNVLRGDMSLVGPRPERPFFTERFEREIPRYADRHRMPAGLTGWAQVNGLHGDTSIADRVRFDNFYIDNWSLWLDLVILARTCAAVAGTGRVARKLSRSRLKAGVASNMPVTGGHRR